MHAHQYPAILNTSTATVFDVAHEARLLQTADHERLRRATQLQHDLTQVLRLCLSGAFKPDEAGIGVKTLLARAGAAPDFPAVDAELRELQGGVRELFERLVV